MTGTPIRRRAMLAAAAGVLIQEVATPKLAAGTPDAGLSPENLEAVQQYYAAWEQPSWQPFDHLLSDHFTFTSPNNDDHIDKNAFKERCWRTQVHAIKRFDLLHVIGSADDAFVLYVGHSSNDHTFRNVEYLQLRAGKIQAIECYFGAAASFASSVNGISP